MNCINIYIFVLLINILIKVIYVFLNHFLSSDVEKQFTYLIPFQVVFCVEATNQDEQQAPTYGIK